jgi:hypothetical protein
MSETRIIRALAMLTLVLAAVGCGDDGDSEPVFTGGDTDAGGQDTAAPDDTGGGDTPGGFLGPCPGVALPGDAACEPVLFGSGGCTEDAEAGCVDLSVALTCEDTDKTGYADDFEGGAVIHVDKLVAIEGADGSLASPFGTIGDALAAAEPGATIVVAPATYVESLLIEGRDGVQIVGVGSCQGQRVQLAAPGAAAFAVEIRGSDDVLLRGLQIGGGKGGVLISGDSANARVDNVEVAKAKGPGIAVEAGAVGATIVGALVRNTEAPGCGIAIAGASGATVERVEIRSIIGAGICLSGATGATLSTLHVHSNIGVGLAIDGSEVEATASTFAGNQQGGVAIAGEGTDASIRGCRVVDNTQVGVAISGDVSASVETTYVGRTARVTTAGGGAVAGYGIALAEVGDEVHVASCRIAQHDAPAVAAFGPNTAIPAPPPPAPGKAAPVLADLAIDEATGAGVYARGVDALRIERAVIDGVAEWSGADDARVADGVSCLESSVYVDAPTIRGAGRYGVAFTDSKGVVAAAGFSELGAADVACSEPLCPNVTYAEGAVTYDAEEVPPAFAPVVAADLLP